MWHGAIASVALLVSLSALGTQVPGGAVRLWYEVPATVSLHEPVVMDVAFENRSRSQNPGIANVARNTLARFVIR
jgi:hypothetical protein